MQRELIKNLKVGGDAMLQGRVMVVRTLGKKVTFVMLSDHTGSVQVVFEKEIPGVIAGCYVTIVGSVVEDKRAKTGVEVHGSTIEIVSAPKEELPVDLTKPTLPLQLTTLLDHRPLTIRHPRVAAIARIYATLIAAYGEALRAQDFTEIKTPKIIASASESGANVFKLGYYDKTAYLAQSPQTYKEICSAAFDRVFEIGPVFRAEKSYTTRHVSEYISLDAEISFIKDHCDVAKALIETVAYVFAAIKERNVEDLALLGKTVPDVPSWDTMERDLFIPLAKMKELIKKEFDYEVPADTDIDPQGERYASEWAQKHHGTTFIFLTEYPIAMRPFYTMPKPSDPTVANGFDLIFNGVEMVTGGQRIHDYDQMLASMKKFGADPAPLDYYLEAFKYGMPPHGGWGWGSERTIARLLDLETIKEVILFPRDVKRLSP